MIPTSFIPTTTVAVTVTDYTISGTGLVTLAANLANGATLTWTGEYLSLIHISEPTRRHHVSRMPSSA